MQQVNTNGIQEETWLGRKVDPLGIVQKIKIWTCWQMVYAQIRICLKNEMHKILWDFDLQMFQ